MEPQPQQGKLHNQIGPLQFTVTPSSDDSSVYVEVAIEGTVVTQGSLTMFTGLSWQDVVTDGLTTSGSLSAYFDTSAGSGSVNANSVSWGRPHHDHCTARGEVATWNLSE